KPDDVGVELYKLYTQCVKDQTEIKLKQYNIKIEDKLGELERTQPFSFPGPLQGHIMLRKVKAGRTYDTTIRILNASCNVRVWLPMWAFPPDRAVPPVTKIAMTASGKIATEFPFDFRFDRDSSEVNDAGFETRSAEPFDVDQKAFIPYALS